MFCFYWHIFQLQTKASVNFSGLSLSVVENPLLRKIKADNTCLIDAGTCWPQGENTLVVKSVSFRHKTGHSPREQAWMGTHSVGRIQRDLMFCLCLCPHDNVRGPDALRRASVEGIQPGGSEGDVKHTEGEQKGKRSSCGPRKTQTCDCCLYLEGQKGVNFVKGRRQSRLKYSVDSSRGGILAYCGGPARDVSGLEERKNNMVLLLLMLQKVRYCFMYACSWFFITVNRIMLTALAQQPKNKWDQNVKNILFFAFWK